jgi:general secretion pathway protein E
LNMDRVKIDPAWAMRIPASLAMRRQIMPFALVNGQVYVACADPSDTSAQEAVERFTGQSVVVAVAERESLQRALSRVYADAATRPQRGSQVLRAIGDSDTDDAVSLSTDILNAAILLQASDIHIEPGREYVRVRCRVDGVLEDLRKVPLSAEAALTSRIKVLAGMDIAERRAPQDGAFSYRFGSNIDSRLVDIRAASLPTKYGEKLTLRLLGIHNDSLTLESLGMSPRDLKAMEQILDQPHGLVLLTGPTGSGKTTTLYAAIQKLLAGDALNIITIEDPIEYDLPGVSQVEVDSAEKVSFAKALRSVLRHDPDVVMIGEIRDVDTLNIAVKAALTGHLVLSTLHTNSAASAATRLADMGLPGYMIASTLRVCVAQRLVRRLCEHCRQPRFLTKAEAAGMGRLSDEGRTVYEPGGCVYCAGKGYAGRIGLFEMLTMNANMMALVSARKNEVELTAAMKQDGAMLLMDDAAEKVFDGLTTTREVLQAVASY